MLRQVARSGDGTKGDKGRKKAEKERSEGEG